MSIWELSDLSTPWCVHVAATLRVSHHIREGRHEIGEIAAAAHADRDALHRVLRHLSRRGVFVESAPGHFDLNPTAEELLDEGMQLTLDLDSFGGRMAHAWGTLLSAVRSGKTAYHEAFGRNFWDDMDANPEIGAKFDALIGPQGHGKSDPEILVDPSDWAEVRSVVDVGGGTGSLLVEI